MEENISTVRQAYNAIADKYESSLSEYEVCYFSEFFQSFEGENVIDLGCGQGRIAEFFHVKKGVNILGCDISENMLEYAHKRNHYHQNIQFILSDMQSVAAALKFDAAIASFSFIHLSYEQARNTLKNLKRLLKKNGSVYISLLCGELCGYVLDPLDPHAKIFVKQYTPVEITELLDSLNYKVTAIRYCEDNDIAALSKEAMFVFCKNE